MAVTGYVFCMIMILVQIIYVGIMNIGSDPTLQEQSYCRTWKCTTHIGSGTYGTHRAGILLPNKEETED
jgi:hypothetical protein